MLEKAVQCGCYYGSGVDVLANRMRAGRVLVWCRHGAGKPYTGAVDAVWMLWETEIDVALGKRIHAGRMLSQ